MRAPSFTIANNASGLDPRAAAVPHATLGKIAKPARIIIQRKRDATRIRAVRWNPCHVHAHSWQCSGIRRLTRYDRCAHDNLLVRNFLVVVPKIARGWVLPRRG